ncbi:MAG: hypothetical protein ACLFVW_06995 [Phycisphaerae bacterium]
MPGKYPTFDRSRLRILPLSQREHLVTLDDLLEVGASGDCYEHEDLPTLAEAVLDARGNNSAVILLMGAHVIKQGLSRYVIDLIRRGWVSLVATNGACAIHDWELARIGATSESVARYIRDGRFGLWSETGEINDVVNAAAAEDVGFGEAVGRHIAESDWAYKDVSIFAVAWQAGVPTTVHAGIGYDILHEHPNFDAAAAGKCSGRDFLVFANEVEKLEGGVVLCYGSAVMGPEVYLKALSMARNVAAQQGRSISRITSAVFDLVRLSGDLSTEAPKDTPEYYYRPYKTVLVRTVRDGGRGFYIRGDHRLTMPGLHRELTVRSKQ